jgi:hypothetical protein
VCFAHRAILRADGYGDGDVSELTAYTVRTPTLISRLIVLSDLIVIPSHGDSEASRMAIVLGTVTTSVVPIVSIWHPIDPFLFGLPIDAAHAGDLASWED